MNRRTILGLLPASAVLAIAELRGSHAAPEKDPICTGCSGNGKCASGFCLNGYCAVSADPCGNGYKCRKTYTCRSGVASCCGSKRCAKKLPGGRCITI